MARYGLAGRMVRSPLNPLWTVGQGVRGLAGAATAAMPAVAEMGDRMVDEAAPEIGKAGGEIARALLPKNPGIAQMAERLAPDAAKMLGRGAYMSAVGAANGLADTLTLENTAGRNLAALAQAGAMSMPQRRPQEEKGPNASLRGQIDEDSARINARIAAGDFAPPAPAQDAGAPEAKGAVPPPAPKPSAPEDEFKDVPTTQLKGATVTGAFGQGGGGPRRTPPIAAPPQVPDGVTVPLPLLMSPWGALGQWPAQPTPRRWQDPRRLGQPQPGVNMNPNYRTPSPQQLLQQMLAGRAGG